MARIDKATAEFVNEDDQQPIMNADVGVIVGTPVPKDSGKWQTFVLKDGIMHFGIFKCDDALEKGDVVTVAFKDESAKVRGKLKKIA